MVAIALAFVLAGLVKGMVGGGLPAVAVPLMITGGVDPAAAAALTLVPVIATNLWLVVQGGLWPKVIERNWSLLLCLAAGSGFGVQILVSVSADAMTTVIGVFVVLLSPLPLLPNNWAIPCEYQRWLNPVAGLTLGIIGGATVMLAPLILYFVAHRLDKELFVTAMGAVALSSMLPLFAGLVNSGVLGWHEGTMAALAFLPTACGMAGGVVLRERISQRSFQRLLGAALLAIGLNLVFGA